MAGCPPIVDSIITSYDDLVGNTTLTSHGTQVALRCEGGYRLDGSQVVQCINGRWDHPVPTCVGTGSVLPTNGELSQVDLIVLTMCVVLATLIFIVLIVLIILYRRKMMQINRKRGLANKVPTKKPQKPGVTYGNPLEDVFMDYNSYGEDFSDESFREYSPDRDFKESSFSREIPQREYRQARDIRDLSTSSKQQRKQRRLKRVQSLDRTFRENRSEHSFTPLSRTVSDSEWSHGGLSPVSFDTSSSVVHFGPAVRWDPRRMYWHESFDYSRSRIPRPQVDKNYTSNYFLQSGQYNTFS